MALEVPATSRLFIRGLAEACTEKAVTDYFKKFGDVATVYIEKDQGCGYVDFKDGASAEKAAADTSLSLQGKPIEAKRLMPQVSSALMSQQAFVEPTIPESSLDVVVIRGACTATGILIAGMLAKAKTTTLVIWDRPSTVQESNLSAALEKRVYNTMEEERPDQMVMGKAFEFFGTGAPKCALLQVQSDQITETANMDQPLMDPEGTAKKIAGNHIQTTSAMYAAGIYQPWVHAYRAVFFNLIPPMMIHDWPHDIGVAMTGSRRLVMADCLRHPDGSGWSVGLQLTTDVPAINAKLATSSMVSIVNAPDSSKHAISGKNIKLTMPSSRAWCKVKAADTTEAPVGIKALAQGQE